MSSPGRFAKGYRPNTGVHPSGHALLAAHRMRALPPLAQPDLRPFDGSVLDQGAAGSCVGAAGAGQLALFLRANMLTPDWLPSSIKWNYAIGRLQQYAGLNPDALPPDALDDVGTEPALFLQAVRNLGFVLQADWPYPTDATTLNSQAKMLAIVGEKPPADVVLKAYPQTGLEYAVYDGPTSGRMAWIIDCLKHRLPVTFGHEVDDAYENNLGDIVRSIDVANTLGGHDELIVAVNARGNAIVKGSWGPSFGAFGYTEWTPALIESAAACSDFQVVRGATVPEAA